MQLRDEAIQEYRDECQDTMQRIRATLSAIEGTGLTPEYDRALRLDLEIIRSSAEIFGFHQIASLAEAMQGMGNRADLMAKGLDHIQRTLETVRKERREAADSLVTDFKNELARFRMQPIGGLLNRYQRMIRDLAKDLGKAIELKLEGTETRVDPATLEALKDPLTHILRNAVDHGIESPAERAAHRKAETGTITIRAYEDADQIVVAISDDGRGLNREKIIEKAIHQGLIAPESGPRMSDPEVWRLIFVAGFSTVDQVSSLSGRGVGMDLVLTDIHRIGGQVDLQTVPGAGTTLILRISRQPKIPQPW